MVVRDNYRLYYDRITEEVIVVKDFTKGVIGTLVVAVICREFYARGYNNTLKFVNTMADVRADAVNKEGEA